MISGGAIAFSDPVDLEVEPLADLAVSIYLPGEVLPASADHRCYARQTNVCCHMADLIRPPLFDRKHGTVRL